VLARRCVGFGGASLVTFAIAANSVFMLFNLAFACYEPDGSCRAGEARLTVAFIISAAATIVTAALTLVGLVRARVRGWPDGGSHRWRAAIAVMCVAPTTLVVLASLCAWFVVWYRT